jgi:hypothetical protein
MFGEPALQELRDRQTLGSNTRALTLLEQELVALDLHTLVKLPVRLSGLALEGLPKALAFTILGARI